MISKLLDIEAIEIMPGFYGKIIPSEEISIAFFEVDKGASVGEHLHSHEQIMHIIEGEFEIVIEGNTHIAKAGDLITIPANKKHKGKALTPCRFMDVFVKNSD
ncbi:cupin domain-containing protein [Maribacter hydrothermalis]|uniref:Cupin n=1 Tax=Maribacter hydrothermalis TaxID=1836467 RepID=A0A1B7ZC55_9FLAO|nr:cupin domain-containing protein [Maribacter hydrothermalis]APQ17923.1 cupin [Maribacter hydrothermalis]OBR40465.1 cupin [Maribacter hydrothermalis]